MRKAFTISSLLISLATATVATPQAPDKLIYEGKVYSLYSNPLESYYESGNVRPSFSVNPDPKSHLTARVEEDGSKGEGGGAAEERAERAK
jgi:hypothetical protein